MVYKFSIYFEFDSSHCPFLLDQLKMRSLKKNYKSFSNVQMFLFSEMYFLHAFLPKARRKNHFLHLTNITEMSR